MSPVIRSFEDTDALAVAALWREVFPDNPPWNVPEEIIARKQRVQRELFYVAVIDGTVEGTALAGFDGHRGWVHLVAVSPRHRRAGIGASLMRTVEAGLAEIGCPKLNFQVRETNADVVAFYESLGYAIEPRVNMGKQLHAR